MKRFLFVAVATTLMLGACKTLEDVPTSVPLGFVTVQMADAPSVHRTSPTAYFVDATNVTIPNSLQNADTCAQIDYPGLSGVVRPLAQIAAGTPVTYATTIDTAQLTPSPADANGNIFYRLASGDSLDIRPGSVNRLTIPGAPNAFHAFDYTFTIADSLKIQPLAAGTDSTHDLNVTWNAQSGASVVVQLIYSDTTTQKKQIFCQFTDNGSHAVQASLANKWRAGTAKRVHAYRFLTSFKNDGAQEVVVLSTYSTDSTTILP